MATRDRSRAAERNAKPAARAAELPMPQNDLAATPSPADRDREIAFPIQGAEARLAVRMSESLAVPTATSFREIAVATLAAERKRLNEALAPRKLSYTHLLAFAVAQAVAVHRGWPPSIARSTAARIASNRPVSGSALRSTSISAMGLASAAARRWAR
jgi:pyruvate/2-oxoglutarate dehydrogenase complex dihydrolipoamide acyltransferase (E2) component